LTTTSVPSTNRSPKTIDVCCSRNSTPAMSLPRWSGHQVRSHSGRSSSGTEKLCHVHRTHRKGHLTGGSAIGFGARVTIWTSRSETPASTGAMMKAARSMCEWIDPRPRSSTESSEGRINDRGDTWASRGTPQVVRRGSPVVGVQSAARGLTPASSFGLSRLPTPMGLATSESRRLVPHPSIGQGTAWAYLFGCVACNCRGTRLRTPTA
jgi:hypothetical protein